jgi:hypothetical protein
VPFLEVRLPVLVFASTLGFAFFSTLGLGFFSGFFSAGGFGLGLVALLTAALAAFALF